MPSASWSQRSGRGWSRSSGRRSARCSASIVDDIPGDVYAGIESGTPTLGVAALWVAAASLDETLAFQIVEALWQPATLSALAAGHPKGAAITAANALRGVAIPVHPGAGRYYRAHGLAA